MKKTQNIRWTSLGAKTSVAILITAALLMLALSAVQSYYARKEIRANLERNTELDLIIKAQKIKYSLEAVEAALQNHLYDIERSLPYPDSLFSVTRRIVEQNPDFDGCCIAMIPDIILKKDAFSSLVPIAMARLSTRICMMLRNTTTLKSHIFTMQ